jgi:UDP-N-acetylmuramoylalanine--D-glutamate ligase
MQIEGKKVLVAGMARSGIAAAQFLAERNARVTINDAKPEAELKEAPALCLQGIEVVGGSHPRALFENSDLIVVSPGVPLALEVFAQARAAGVPVIAEVELAARYLRGRLVGITGTNGKTTTTALTGELLAKAGLPTQVGGNIGTPLISLVESSRDDGFTVVELSSFQLEAVDQMRLFAAVIINITPDHLDRYDSVDAYAAAKARIFRNQTADDFAILNEDDPRVSRMHALTPARIVRFSRERELEEGIFLRGDQIIHRANSKEQVLITREEIRVPGEHNIENMMAAFGLALSCGAAPDALRRAAGEFAGVEHRLEFVAAINGANFYNDSKATNVDAAIKCIEAFDRNVIVILGGKDKGSDYAPLAPLVRDRCRHVILLGAAADKIGAALVDTRPLHRAASMQQAVEIGAMLAQPGDTVLLAPACASFDMFDNFEHRGRVFKEAVRKAVARGSKKVESGE